MAAEGRASAGFDVREAAADERVSAPRGRPGARERSKSSNGHRPRPRLASRGAGPAPARLPQTAYGGLVTRTIAFVVDAAIIDGVAAITAAAGALVVALLHVPGKHHTTLVAIGGAAFVIGAAVYFIVFWSLTGQTPGDRLMQVRVLSTTGERLRPRRSLVRVVALVVAILPLGAGTLPILFTKRRRGLQDWIAGTVVVVVPAARGDGASLTETA